MAVIAIAIFAQSCSGRNNKPIIMFSADSSAIIIKGIDEASLLQVKNIYSKGNDTVNLISVVLKPGEPDSLQDDVLISGKINLSGDSLVFHPDQAFQKGKKYLVESYVGVSFANAKSLVNGTVKPNLQPQKQILTR